ncbi:MAG: STAS domain-containing protein [Terriglobales bacterium]
MTSNIATATDLEITLDEGDGTALVRLRGRLSIDTSPALRDQLLAVLDGPSVQAVIVDLDAVSYIDASGVATLIEGLKIAQSVPTTLCLKGLQGRVLHLFEVTGLLSLFDTSGCKGAFLS